MLEDMTLQRKLAEANIHFYFYKRSLVVILLAAFSSLVSKLLSVCLSLPVFAEKMQNGGGGAMLFQINASYSLVLTKVFVQQASLQTFDSLEQGKT